MVKPMTGYYESFFGSILDGIRMVTQYGYDAYGHNTSITYPSGITINNVYDSNNRGYLSEIWRGSDMLWKLNSSNSRGQPVNYNLGAPANGLQTSFTYDAQGRVSGITTGQMKQTLSFDPASGNLLSRDYRIVNNPSGLTEHFEYDQLNRLIKSVVMGQDSIMAGYSPNGNITNKSDAGSYTYDATQVNAVTDISGNPGSISLAGQTIEYNSFNLTTNIVEGDSSYSILYNPCNQRIKTVYIPQSGTEVTKYYSGGYEKIISGGVTKETNYISSPFGVVALIVKQGESIQTYFAETDHLGSIIGLLNADKTYAQRASFDAWGRRRNPADWSYQNVPVPQITDRGFTGHEHLDAFGLINMNWRMYDPVLGRFLGDDPIIQAPDFSQSFNLYSYCVNNPLANIDPSGYKYEAPFQEEEQRELSNWSLEYLMLIHKLNNTDLTFAEKLDYLNGIDPQVIEIIYRLRKNQGNQSLIDVTDKFNTTINNTRQYFSDLDKVLKEDIIDPVMRHAFKLWIFANLVKTGAPFDLKNNEYSAEKIGEKSLFNNIEVRYDSYGNYNYGVAARAFGITLKEALAGAGINEVFKGDGHPDFTNLNGFFDTKSGSIDIIRGYFGLPFR